MSKTVVIGISDLNVAKPPDMLVTYALGSCVGICLYDPNVRVAGLSHILLPSSKLLNGGENTPMKFADTAIPLLIRKMEAMGARRGSMKAKIAGGAQMFAATGNASIANIGARNVVAVKETLRSMAVPILAEETGLNYGRTVFFNTNDFSMTIKSPKRGDWTG